MITAAEFRKWMAVFRLVAGGGGGNPLVYLGTWDANANTPTLTSGVGTAQTFYVVSVAGNTVLNGVGDWEIGDWAIFNGTVWQKIPVQDADSNFITVRTRTVGELNATYDNGPNNDGIGSSLTMNNVGEFTNNGVTFTVVGSGIESRLCVIDQINPIVNGIYQMSIGGNVSTAAKFVRVNNFNNSSNVIPGTTILAAGGIIDAGGIFYLEAFGTVDVGIDAINFEKAQALDATKLPLTGGELTGNLGLKNFSELFFLNGPADYTQCLKFGMYDYSGTGLYALTLDSIEAGVAKQTFVVFQDDPGVTGQIKYSFSFPKVTRNIAMTDQGKWTGAQPVLPITLSNVSSTINIDAASGNLFQLTLNGNKTIAAPSNPIEGTTIEVYIKQDPSTPYTVTLDPAFVALMNSAPFAMSPVLGCVGCLNAKYMFSQWNFSFS